MFSAYYNNMGINSSGTNGTISKSDSLTTTSYNSTTTTAATMRSDQIMNSYLNPSMLLTQQQIEHCFQQSSNIPIQHHSNIRITLDDKDLWSRFYHVTNEMILTKAGR